MLEGKQFNDSAEFLRRALLDFALAEAFEARGLSEQEASLRWVAAARDSKDEEWRVTQLLDDLSQERPLPGATIARSCAPAGRAPSRQAEPAGVASAT